MSYSLELTPEESEQISHAMNLLRGKFDEDDSEEEDIKRADRGFVDYGEE